MCIAIPGAFETARERHWWQRPRSLYLRVALLPLLLGTGQLLLRGDGRGWPLYLGAGAGLALFGHLFHALPRKPGVPPPGFLSYLSPALTMTLGLFMSALGLAGHPGVLVAGLGVLLVGWFSALRAVRYLRFWVSAPLEPGLRLGLLCAHVGWVSLLAPWIHPLS